MIRCRKTTALCFPGLILRLKPLLDSPCPAEYYALKAEYHLPQQQSHIDINSP